MDFEESIGKLLMPNGTPIDTLSLLVNAVLKQGTTLHFLKQSFHLLIIVHAENFQTFHHIVFYKDFKNVGTMQN